MFRKITLITMAVVLGLAVFAGCSNEAVTSSDVGSETGNSKNVYGVEGDVTQDELPVGAFLRLYERGDPTLLASKSNNPFTGWYKIGMSTAYGTGWFTITCQRNTDLGPTQSKDFYFNNTCSNRVDFEY